MALSIASTLNLNINDNIGINELMMEQIMMEQIQNYQIIVFINELMNEIMYKGGRKREENISNLS
jgi:hypothetical protein